MTEFEKWDVRFRSQDLFPFNNDPNGLLWLKVRAISRSKQLKKFAEENKLQLKATKVSAQNVELYDTLMQRPDAMKMLDGFLRCMNNEWYTQMGVNVEQLKEDLYSVDHYNWGGDHNNSLDRYLVSRYVKVISDYNALLGRQAEIGANAWDYVRNSWYNNWTSFIIESLFKRNPKVISAVGEIKSVDFFLDGFPVDLKVTFFSNEYMELKLKAKLGKSTLSWLKDKCKASGIVSNPTAQPSQQYYTLTEKLKELNKTEIIDQLNSARREIVDEARRDPMELMKWLYENQGEMRFGAENRLFLILVDTDDMAQSWKLKRAFALIEPTVKTYLDSFTAATLRQVNFTYKKQGYKALADALFVVK